MNVAVWDTYVDKKDGNVMHFDILAPGEIMEETLIHEMGKQYLLTKGQDGQPLTAKQCRLCHMEVASAEISAAIKEKGYYIIEMEGCD